MSILDNMLLRNTISASLSNAASGDTTLLAVPATKRFRLVSLVACASGGANTVVLKTGSTTRSAAISLAATTGQLVLPPHMGGWIVGALGEDFIWNNSAATAVTGSYTYILMDS